MTTIRRIRLGTRGSNLALRQAAAVADALRSACPGISIQTAVIATSGDRLLDRQPPAAGDKGMFTRELERELVRGTIDIAAHSLKDMPARRQSGLCIAAVLKRENPLDVLVADRKVSLRSLPSGATIGTASLRRGAQLRALRPDLVVVPVRGNVDTRIRKMREQGIDALLLAYAGVARLGFAALIAEIIPAEIMLPAPGQGTIAVEARCGDSALLSLLEALTDPVTMRETAAERAFLQTLDADCRIPVGCLARADGAMMTIRGCVASPDGSRIIAADASAGSDNPGALGTALAEMLLRKGAADMLAGIRHRGEGQDAGHHHNT